MIKQRFDATRAIRTHVSHFEDLFAFASTTIARRPLPAPRLGSDGPLEIECHGPAEALAMKTLERLSALDTAAVVPPDAPPPADNDEPARDTESEAVHRIWLECVTALGVSNHLVVCETKLVNVMGIHARPANQLVKVAESFHARTFLASDTDYCNVRSINGIMLLAAGRGARLTIVGAGHDAAAAVLALRDTIERGFGEWVRP